MKKLSNHLAKVLILGSFLNTLNLVFSQPAYSRSPKCSTDSETMTMARYNSRSLVREVMSPMKVKLSAVRAVQAVGNNCIVRYKVEWKQYGTKMEAMSVVLTDSNGFPVDYKIESY